MSTLYKLTFGKGMTKLINLKTVSSLYQYKNRITVTYNYNASNGLLIFGSGYIHQEPHTEVIHFENEDFATQSINHLEKLMEKV